MLNFFLIRKLNRHSLWKIRQRLRSFYHHPPHPAIHGLRIYHFSISLSSLSPYVCYIIIFFCLFVCFLGLHLQHIEVPRLGVEPELQLPTYLTATAMPDLRHICELCHSSRQHQILNPLSEAKDQTCILTDTSQIRFCWAITGTPQIAIFVCVCVCVCLFAIS